MPTVSSVRFHKLKEHLTEISILHFLRDELFAFANYLQLQSSSFAAGGIARVNTSSRGFTDWQASSPPTASSTK